MNKTQFMSGEHADRETDSQIKFGKKMLKWRFLEHFLGVWKREQLTQL